MTLKEQVKTYKDDIDLFEEIDEKIEYILDLASMNETEVTEEERIDSNKVNGCSSEAWLLHSLTKDGVVVFRARGESSMARGMLGMLLSVYSHRKPSEILEFDKKNFFALGFDDILSPTRQQSLEAFLNKVYAVAKSYS